MEPLLVRAVVLVGGTTGAGSGPLLTGLLVVTPVGMKSTKRRDWSAGAMKRAEGCRACGNPRAQLHHIVPRSLQGDDHEDNFVGLCDTCHRAAHDKAFDLLTILEPAEQVHAVELLGLQRAHILLAPSEHPERRAA